MLDQLAIDDNQRTTWEALDYGKIGITLQIAGEDLCESMVLHAKESVLDVAAGNGNASLAAARRFCHVTSTDDIEHLLHRSQNRAQAEGLNIDYQKTAAEYLPFADNCFDNVVSAFGVMFKPNQKQNASEMIRVCNRGGKIGLANWTPDGFIGAIFELIGKFKPLQTGVDSPTNWGTENFLIDHFGTKTARIVSTKKYFNFRAPSPQHWVDLIRDFYSPVHNAFIALDPLNTKALEEDLLSLIERFNQAKDQSMLVPSEYLEVVITK
jgi:ubiquinone/menaquinone biosynthesis C-methylase UbiE